MEGQHESRIEKLEAHLAELTEVLAKAKDSVQSWVDANSNLSHSAAEARAKNQGAGRGFLGGFLGPKFRSAMRAGAAASNAEIAREVREKRAKIAAGKREAQELVRDIQRQIAAVKQELKVAKAESKGTQKAKASAAKAASNTIDLMHKLKEAHAAGILTDDEYESKRQKLLEQL